MFGLLARGGANLDWSHGHFVPSLILDRSFHLPLSISRRTHQLSSSVRAIPDNPAVSASSAQDEPRPGKSAVIPHRCNTSLLHFPRVPGGPIPILPKCGAIQLPVCRAGRRLWLGSRILGPHSSNRSRVPHNLHACLGVVDGSRLNRLFVLGAARQTFLPPTLHGGVGPPPCPEQFCSRGESG